MDVADPRDARAGVCSLYLLPQGVYRAKAVMPRLRRGGGGVFTDMSVSPRRWLSQRNSMVNYIISRLFAGIEGEHFYFVHSYAVRELPPAPDRQITWAEHGGDRFVAAVEEGPLWSTQFHPEKSGDAGARLIANWVGTL